jgi:hypothetical protein
MLRRGAGVPSLNDDGEIPVVTFGPGGPRFRCRCVATPSRLAVVQSLRCMKAVVKHQVSMLFLHAPGRERERERDRGHRTPGELPEAFEAHCRLVEGEPERRRRAALHQPGSPSQGGEGVSRLPHDVLSETAHAAEPDPACR